MDDILQPKSLTIPVVTPAIRDAMVADVGTIILNSSTGSLNYCASKTAGSTNWEQVFVVRET